MEEEIQVTCSKHILNVKNYQPEFDLKLLAAAIAKNKKYWLSYPAAWITLLQPCLVFIHCVVWKVHKFKVIKIKDT